MAEKSIIVRAATLRDVPRLALVYTQAMCEDEVFDFVNCHRDIYPDDHLFRYEQRLRKALYDPSLIVMVAESWQKTPEPERQPSRQIISLAIWSTRGVGLPRKVQLRELFIQRIMSMSPSILIISFSSRFALINPHHQVQSYLLRVGALLSFLG